MQKQNVPLSALAPEFVSVPELLKLCQSDKPDGRTYICRMTSAGSANVRIFSAGMPENPACKEVGQFLSRSDPHCWPEEFLVLCNFPCYIAPHNGSVILEDLRLIEESIYPSAGEQTLSRLLGIDLDEGGMEKVIAEAAKIEVTGFCSAFFSRWSDVYFHALSESLAQDSMFKRAGIGSSIVNLGRRPLTRIQQKLVDLVRPQLYLVDHDIVGVPRTVFSTVARRHAALGTDFRLAIEEIRLLVAQRIGGEKDLRAPKKLYVSRDGKGMRPLQSEAEIELIFEKEGFEIARPETLSIEEQAMLFSKAQVVAGPHGAGLANAAFALPGAVVFEMRGLNREGASPGWNETYRKLSCTMGLSYGFHLEENQINNDSWSLPPETAAQIARALSAGI